MPKERTFMLSEMKINDYIDLLASDAPAPGGGSASGNYYTYQIVLFAGSVLVLIAGLIFAWKFKSNL